MPSRPTSPTSAPPEQVGVLAVAQFQSAAAADAAVAAGPTCSPHDPQHRRRLEERLPDTALTPDRERSAAGSRVVPYGGCVERSKLRFGRKEGP